MNTIEEQGKLTPELKRRINVCWNATELEDIYLPYKPKRKTRAEAARQKGLEPLATILMMQRENNLMTRARTFLNKDVKDEEEALKGARDIIAEQVSEDERSRNQLRNQFNRQAIITSKVVKGKEEEAIKYKDYFDFSEPLKRCSSHRLLAIRRGEAEGLLKVSISPNACVIMDKKPHFIGVDEILKYSTDLTLNLLKRELEIRLEELEASWHYYSLERLFFENKVYKVLEGDAKADVEKLIERIEEDDDVQNVYTTMQP